MILMGRRRPTPGWRTAWVARVTVTALLGLVLVQPGTPAVAAVADVAGVAKASHSSQGSHASAPAKPSGKAPAPAESAFGALAPSTPQTGKQFYVGSIGLDPAKTLKQLASGTAPGRLGLHLPSNAATQTTATALKATSPKATSQTASPNASGPQTMYPPAYVDPSQPRYTLDSSLYPNGTWTAKPVDLDKATCLANINTSGIWLQDRFRSCVAYSVYVYSTTSQITSSGSGPTITTETDGFSFDLVVTAFGSSTSRDMQFSYYAYKFSFQGVGSTFGVSISMNCVPGNNVGDCHMDRGTFNTTAGAWETTAAPQVVFHAQSLDDPAHVYSTDPDKITPGDVSTDYVFDTGVGTLSHTQDYPFPIRFDSNAGISGRPAAALFPTAVPTLTFDQSDVAITQAAAHIYDALDHPQFTAPTWSAGVKTMPGAGSDPTDFLTRTTVAQKAINRGISCPKSGLNPYNPPQYTPINPGGGTAAVDCDEYPPASTWEGAYDTAYTTTPAFSVRFINAAQNQEAGNRLGAFYQTQRLLNGDAFAVNAIGTPPNTAPYPVPNVPAGGQFLTVWGNTGTFTGPLGAANGYPVFLPDGQFQWYTGGSIMWSPANGTHAVTGAIGTEYWANTGPMGALGYPIGDQYPIGAGVGQDFQNGTIYSSPAGTYTVFHDLLSTYLGGGGPTGPLGFPITGETASGGGKLQKFQSGQITDISGTVTLSRWVIGHAANAGNDYPYETLGQFGNTQDGTDAWNEFYGQCDSFAAWKVYENLVGSAAQHPSGAPSPGWTPSNASVSPVNQFTWGPNGGKYGNADVWASKFSSLGYTVDTIPTPGAIAYWPNATTDSQDNNPPDSAHGLGGFGHVALVSDVYVDGSITIQQYNMRENGEYSVAHMAFGQGYSDTGFNGGGFSVPWPKYFIHVADGPSGGASPAEPANGIVQAGNPSQVLVIGPGSPSSQFSTGNVWYNDPGHGEIGREMYTHTNGPTAVSTATWTAPVTASACYRVDALVPNQYSDNPTAIYTVTDQLGTHTAAINENRYTGDWAELGVYEATLGGQITVKLDDRGNTGLYVAADGMRFWPQPCGGYGNAAPVTMATSANGTWSLRSGHGFFGTEQYATTSGSVTTESKWSDYSVSVLPNTCYEISAYVPDNYSDNPGAKYQVQDARFGNFYPQVDENPLTNQFTSLGIFKSTGNGTLWVELGNEGPSGLYVAADALAFVVDPGCAGLPGRAAPAGATLVGLNDNSAWFSTKGDWNSGIGHGFYNHDLWIPTTGSGTASSTATWNAFLSPHACYNVSAWIPAGYYANNTQAAYQVMTWNGSNGAGGPFGTVNQNNVGDAWAYIGQVTTQTGEVTVTLGNTGNSGSYTAADELEFAPC